MNKFACILVILAVIGNSYAQRPGYNCDMNNFQSCTSVFADFLGVSSTNVFDELFLLRGLYNKFTTGQSVGDVVNLCNQISNFYTCLTTDQIRQCLSPLGWVNQGKSPAQAYINDGTLRQWAFLCGVGLDLFQDPNSYDCIRRTFANNFKQLVDGALYPYMQNIAFDPANACNYSEQLQIAWTNIFYNSSVCYNDRREYTAQFIGCAAALEYTSAQFSHCMHQNSCKWIARWSNISYLKEIDGVMHLKVVPYWQKDKDGKLYQTKESWMPLN
uniref:Secreted protein n=1 Tax=Panagrolaimus superbus TaxID=310955 RepID=A0A914Z1M7_9BILA